MRPSGAPGLSLARFFVDDPDDAQTAKRRPAAIAAMSQRSFVSVTVLLELEGVLWGFCALPYKDVSRVLHALAGMAHITLEDRPAVQGALEFFDKGLDFADALHLARSSRCAGLSTFDQRLAKRARSLGSSPQVQLLDQPRSGPCRWLPVGGSGSAGSCTGLPQPMHEKSLTVAASRWPAATS
jgi:predicted nucleic-acid-binding protein